MNPVTSARLVCSLAVALAGLLYLNALDNPFIYDDYRVIVENRALSGPANLRAVIGHDATRPVAAVSYAVDRALWGSGPFGFHVTNVLLHMINVALFGLLAWRVAEDRRQRAPAGTSSMRPEIVAPVGALLFAVHPMLTGAVGYISARPEVLCATFVLLALLAARQWLIGRGGMWLAATIALWLVALATKETAAVLPLVVLAYDRWILTPADSAESRRRLLWLHAPLFGLAAVLSAIRLAVFVFVEQGGIVDFQWPLAWVELDVVRRYATMLVVPAGQSIYHAVTPFAGALQPRAIVNVAFFAALAVLIWTQRRSPVLLSFGLAWFAAFLLPSTLLVMLNRGEPMAEHRIYLASCGVFLLAGSIADRVWAGMAAGQRVTRIVLVAGLVAILVTLGGHTVLRNALWNRPVLVWLEAAERAPNDWLPHRVLGEELHRAGQHAQAIAAFTRAVELGPAEVSALGKLGVCLSEQGDLSSADAVFTKMQALDLRSPEASNGLATVALLRGNLEAARRGYLATLGFDAMNVAARRGLAVIAEAPGGNPAEALRLCREVKSLDPASADMDACISRNLAKLGGGRDGKR